ncbi:hypothetical protein PDL71_08520 [Lacibacter sp. MH-610]|uniref:AbiJ-NTD4 domain-containing protein n=1 Tax=Lacibacter sp. MH-610 TaxID=3020883 RepID=UPI00389296E2
MKFSQRIGKKPATKNIQLESIDEDLLNGLWNISKIYIIDRISRRAKYGGDTDFDLFSNILWHKFYRLPIDTIPDYDFKTEKFIRENFFKGQWYETYDFIEFLTSLDFDEINTKDFITAINSLLEHEFSAYRFIDGKIAPISNKIEVNEIQQSLEQVNYFTSLSGANIHLTNALEKLSDRKNPDYRNSIKESISAIETTCRVLTGESTLGKALNSLEHKGIKIDDQLKSGFDKIYAFTNNKQSGIRHAIIEEHNNPDFDDAKYMLVVSSSFINYLVGKCKKLGITIK